MSNITNIMIIAVVAVAAIGGGAYFIMNNQNNVTTVEDTTDMYTLASGFAEAYDGVLGTFEAMDGHTSDKTTVSHANAGSERLPYSKVTWTKTKDAKADYDKTSEGIKAKTAIMGSQPKMLSVTGFSNITAMKYDVTMGGQTFSMIYFTAYEGNTLIESYDECLYKASSAVTDHFGIKPLIRQNPA